MLILETRNQLKAFLKLLRQCLYGFRPHPAAVRPYSTTPSYSASIFDHTQLQCVHIRPHPATVRPYSTTPSYSASIFDHTQLQCVHIRPHPATVRPYSISYSAGLQGPSLYAAEPRQQCCLLY